MVLGIALSTYTTMHVIISLIGIGSGLTVLFGLLSGRLLHFWNGLFLITTILTSVTGFFFPFTKITPGIILVSSPSSRSPSRFWPSTHSISTEDGAAPTPSPR
jgi:hypothetical protein